MPSSGSAIHNKNTVFLFSRNTVSSSTPALADIHPGFIAGILLHFRNGQFDGRIAAACRREDGCKALHGLVQKYPHPLIDGKGAYAAYCMTDHGGCLLVRQHFSFGAEAGFVFGVIHLGIACGADQNGFLPYLKRQGFHNAASFRVQSLRRQFHRGAGHGKFQDSIFHTKARKIGSYFLN